MKTINCLLLALLCCLGAQAGTTLRLYPSMIQVVLGEGENGRQLVAKVTESTVGGTTETYEVQDVVEWSTTDPSVVTVDSTGYATFVAPGHASINAVYKNQYTASCEVALLPPHPGGDEAVTMLREDLTWVYLSYYYGITNIRYTVKAKGDTVIDGRQYKQFHRNVICGSDYPTAPSKAFNFTKQYLHEESGKVYTFLSADGLWLQSYPYTANVSDTGARDYAIYDFNDPDVYGKAAFNKDFKQLPDVVIDGVPRKVYRSADRVIVEGLGMEALSNNSDADVINPMLPTRWKNGWYTLFQYVANSKGEILIYRPTLDEYPVGGNWDDIYWDEDIIEFAYHPYNFNTDGVFDIEDLNLAINRMMTNPTDPTTDKYYHEYYPFYHTMDVNFDGTVDIEDINMLINQLLHESDTYKLTDLVNVATE